jgi:hypothetical protein
MKTLLISLTMLSLMISSAFAGGDHMNMPAYEGSAPFQRLKSLAGHWEGTSKMEGVEGKEDKVTVDYAVTSNGSAVVETLFPGTKEEMVSVYSDYKGKLSMMHYCMLGNQPKMDMVSSTDKEIFLNFSPDNAIDPLKEMHMHSLKIKWNDDGSLTQEWTNYTDGQPAKEPSVFTFSKVK